MDIDYERYENDPENYTQRDIPETRLISRTAPRVLKEFAVFFEELRDSLRNIELDIEKYSSERNLLNSETFWTKFINKSIALNRPESTLWDFKESLEMWHAHSSERQKWQIDFCNLVAAFANNEGGAIIIGITNTTRKIIRIRTLRIE